MLDATTDKLTRGETTRDELLEQSEREVHSTTPTKKDSKSARIKSAQLRAKELFENPNYGECSLVEKLQKELDELKKQVVSQKDERATRECTSIVGVLIRAMHLTSIQKKTTVSHNIIIM